MHDPLAVHFVQSAQNGEHDLLHFMKLELLLGFDLVIDQSSFQ